MEKNEERQFGSPMVFARCGRSGLHLPLISLGLWHSFGNDFPFERGRSLCLAAFDLGIWHFDIANNYGPPRGAAEENFGRILRGDLHAHRDELVISTKAGYWMWRGPYGEWGSRKHMLASLDQSLRRLRLDYVDIFYSHRLDPGTPLEETMGALASVVKSGKALYAGISNYSPEETDIAARLLRELGTPCLIHQPRYSMLNRTIEASGLFKALTEHGIGCIAFSPLAQGLLSSKYLNGLPEESRATLGKSLKQDFLGDGTLDIVRELNTIAAERGQSLAQMAIAWVLRDQRVTSALVGASRPEQLRELVGALDNWQFSADELKKIDVLTLSPL